ncbi:MAG: translation initiation factor IF-2 [Planctomycetes bacterium]|nr:translation initiation factor IF-2 [Planctomycetota bacterium]
MQQEKVRVYALARELDVESKDLLDMCKQAGLDVKNQLSSLDTEQVVQIRELVKRGTKGATAAQTPAKPVTPVMLPEVGKSVPNLSTRPRREAEPLRAPPAPPPDKSEEPPLAPAAQAPSPGKPLDIPSRTPPVLDGRPRMPTGEKPAAATQEPAAKPPAAKPGETKPATPSTPPSMPPRPAVPAAPSPRTPPTLGSGRPGGGRPPLRRPPTMHPGLSTAPRPQNLTLRPAKPLRKPEELVQKPIARLTADQLKPGAKPIRPEDVLRPPLPAGPVEEIDDDDESADKSKKPKAVVGRDSRKNERNRRAIERKNRQAEVDMRRGQISDDDSQISTAHRIRIKNRQRPITLPRKGKLILEPPITVRSVSEALGVRSVEVLFKLRDHGAPPSTTINSTIEPAMAELLAIDFGSELEIRKPATAEDDLLASFDKPDEANNLLPRAPIVTIMGHVDHGKTSLLDKIRSSDVVATEAGGITQVIRAWRVEHGGRPITFLDTPGHEAFTKMRARGAQVTDIAVIVVAADDGVMPQTEEAINHAKAAGVSLVVAINKVDLPSANINKTRQQLYSLGVLPDNMGGDAPFVETSAATGKGIDELLDQLALVAELKELKANPNKAGRGTCLEAMLSEGEGVRATLLVSDGTLRRGDVILCGHAYGRVRQMYDDQGRPLQEAGPSVPVRITGLDEIPNADDPFQVVPDLATAREIADSRKAKLYEAGQFKRAPLTLENLIQQKVEKLYIVLKADFRGSIEAIKKELEKLRHDEVKVEVLHTGIGAITESDVQLALTSIENTIIVGFNAVPDDRALALAEEKGVQIREYDIIYNLTNDIRAALEGKLKPREEIVHLGRAVVRETFKISRVGTIAGCLVTQGIIRRNAKVRVIRQGAPIYPPPDRTAGLESLKRFKEDVGEVRENFECGIKIAGYDDIKVDDIIEAYRVEQVQRTL